MLLRGMAGAENAPLGRTKPGHRARPRRAAGFALARRCRGPLMAPKREYRVLPLGNGRYRLITIVTTVTESFVTAEKLAELGLPIPEQDVPWRDGEPKQELVWRRDKPREPDVETALEYWNQRVGGHDDRLLSQMPQWVNEFHIAGVREAIDIVATQMPHGPVSKKYAMLVRVFREMRERLRGRP